MENEIFLERHFYHEVKRMQECFYDLLRTMYPSPPIKGRANFSETALESFLVHVRTLYEFFYNSGGSNLAHAKDYLEGVWENPIELQGIERWNTQINNYLIHLSKERGLQKSKPYTFYPIGVLYRHFKRLVIDFLHQLLKNTKNDILQSLLEDLEKEEELVGV